MPSPLPPITEAQWQRTVLDVAYRHVWRVFHPITSQKKGHYATFQAGAKGYPDLTLARAGDGILFVELKTDTGKLRPEQEEWRDTILAAGGEWHLWRPSDYEIMYDRLRNRWVRS
jgi:hypothetical protein